MQIAMILSDLKSLSVCGHEEALALVNVHKKSLTSVAAESSLPEPAAPSTAGHERDKTDPDLQRAKDLVELHHEVKLRYLEQGHDPGLQKARQQVKHIQGVLASRSFG